jgi:myosin heavy subunit
MIGRCSKDIELEELQKERLAEKAEYARLLDGVKKMKIDAEEVMAQAQKEKENVLEEKARIDELVSQQQLKTQFAEAKVAVVENSIREAEVEKQKYIKLQIESKKRVEEAKQYEEQMKAQLFELNGMRQSLASAPNNIKAKEDELNALIRANQEKETELLRREKKANDDYRNNVIDAESNRKKEAELVELARKLKVNL